MKTPLSGWRVLVPRGGRWGEELATLLRDAGATPLIAPLIEFAPSPDPDRLVSGIRRLGAGEFDWLVVTSATTVEQLRGVQVPTRTRIAAVGESTAAALQEAGLRVDFVPETDFSARSLLKEWPDAVAGLRIFLPQSEIAHPALKEGLRARGHHVEAVAAYRTVGVPVGEDVMRDVREGHVRAILVTSGSVAREVATQLAPIPEGTLVACIGARTADDARAAGLTVGQVARRQSTESLVRSLITAAEAAR